MFDLFNSLISPSTNLFDKIFALLGIIGIPISIIAFGFAIFFLIYGIYIMFMPKPVFKCRICQKTDPDSLSAGNKQWWYLCREHLLERYSDLFLKNTFKVVMTEFTSDDKSKNPDDAAFTYYPFSSHKEYNIGNPKILKQLLDSIDGNNCSKCGSKAKILFVNKEDAVRTSDNYIIPSEEYLTRGQYLCNKHALDNVIPALKSYPQPIVIEGGVWLPYKEDGFQRPDEP